MAADSPPAGAIFPTRRSVPRLLVVDADDVFAAALCRRLAREGFAAESARTPRAARERLAAETFALVVLDLGLPGLDIASMVQAGRGLITVSRDASSVERVISLEMGADDSLSKPVHPQELAARIRAVLRRRAAAQTPRPAGRTTRFDGWELKRLSRRLTSPTGAPVPLSDAEYGLLTALLETPRQVVSRAQLLARARGAERSAPNRSIDLLVSRLRQKLGTADGRVAPIRTVRGAGYLLDVRSLDG